MTQRWCSDALPPAPPLPDRRFLCSVQFSSSEFVDVKEPKKKGEAAAVQGAPTGLCGKSVFPGGGGRGLTLPQASRRPLSAAHLLVRLQIKEGNGGASFGGGRESVWSGKSRRTGNQSALAFSFTPLG